MRKNMLVLACALAVGAANAAPLPKIVITHAMGMMPVGCEFGGCDTFYCMTNTPYTSVLTNEFRWDLLPNHISPLVSSSV